MGEEIMNTDKRLTEAYENARIEYFNDSSKYIIFSDIHRGNGSHFDEFSKNQNVFRYALEYYFENGYTYIEAGDGDELWVNPRVADIKNAHFHIFETYGYMSGNTYSPRTSRRLSQ